jgi:hypothetical protein
MWNVKTLVILVTRGGNWKHHKITQKISEQHTGKAHNHRTAENSHIGHCTHTSESTNVKVQ